MWIYVVFHKHAVSYHVYRKQGKLLVREATLFSLSTCFQTLWGVQVPTDPLQPLYKQLFSSTSLFGIVLWCRALFALQMPRLISIIITIQRREAKSLTHSDPTLGAWTDVQSITLNGWLAVNRVKQQSKCVSQLLFEFVNMSVFLLNLVPS